MPLFVGTLSAFLTHDAMTTFETIQKPVLSPPGWLFPIVWTILYILMGIASYLVLTTESSQHVTLFIYKIQLFFNFIWPIIFFNLRLYLLAFIWLIILWLLILITAILFYKTNKLAGYLMLPYLIWVTFAGYLNLSIYLLN
ncbi:tryptophan-rich sensory protein [Thomasclavelia ramosa]|nr:tryptophan-rich sensory protein [Thomasclavelia ramosa]